MNDKELFERVKEQEQRSLFGGGISPLFLHIAILLLLILIIYFFFISDFSGEDQEEISTLVLIGDVTNFSKEHNGDLEVYSAYYNLKTQNGIFDGENRDFLIENFSGIVYVENESMYFRGTSPKVTFGKNELNLKNDEFTLKSTTKTTFSFFVESLNLHFNEGRIKFAEELNNDFTNSTIEITNYNTSVTYDGTFSFKGVSESFDLKNPTRKLNIQYNLE